MKPIAAILLGYLLIGSGIVNGAIFSPLRQGCDGFNSRLNVGDFVLVTSPALNIRGAPGTNAERLRDPLEPGTPASIVQGPECVDGYTWWNVTADGTQGWVAEGNPDTYFLSEPVDPDQIDQSDPDFDASGDANPNPPLSTLDGKPGGGNYEYACRGLDDGLIARDPSTSSN